MTGDIEARAARIGVNLSEVDLDSIHLPPGEDLGILRFNLNSNSSFFFFNLSVRNWN